MRVRIIQRPGDRPDESTCDVEIKYWWQIRWTYYRNYQNERDAIDCAKILKNPMIVEIE